MNTTLHYTKTPPTEASIVLLVEKEKLPPAKEQLSPNNYNLLQKLAKEGVKNMVFAQDEQLIFVEILQNYPSLDKTNEKARLRGADCLERINDYKQESVSLQNLADQQWTVAFAEGMLLANYQFLKYVQ